MAYFVEKGSIVRRVWGNGDTVLLIFAGSAAEFALSKAVDWLYFTGRLPSDPLGRLFSTVAYAHSIVFSEKNATLMTIDTMAHIHAKVEEKRGYQIPAWAYRDVLYMLIDYSIRSFEVLERKMTSAEKEEVFKVFYQVGDRMGLVDLPDNYSSWVIDRNEHLDNNLEYSSYTKDLFAQYKKHLGTSRYYLLMQAQTLLVPKQVRSLLGLRRFSFIQPLLVFYKLSRLLKVEWIMKDIILPSKYLQQIKDLDRVSA